MALSDAMRIARIGRFTASQFYRLMGGSAGYVTCEFTEAHTCYERVKGEDGFIYVPCESAPKGKKSWKRDNTFLPDGADAYVIEKVAELLDSEQLDSYTSLAMQYGVDTEPLAIAAIQKRYGVTLECTGEDQYFFSDDKSGATPDGVEFEDDGFTMKSTHEVKCPIGTTHVFNCLKVLTAADLKKHYPCYYHQVVGQLLHTAAKIGYWHSYRPTNETRSLHTVVIYRDDQEIVALKNRINLAHDRKNSYLSNFN